MLDTRSRLDNHIKSASPNMKAGDKLHQTMIENIEAFKQGQNYHNSRVPEVNNYARDATPEQRKLYGQGASNQMGFQIGGLRDGRNIAANFLATPNRRAIAQVAAPDTQSAQRMNDFLEAEETMARSQQNVLGGSTTAKQIKQMETEGLLLTEKLGETTRGGIWPAIKNTVASGIERVGKISAQERQEIAKILSDTSEEGLQEFIKSATQALESKRLNSMSYIRNIPVAAAAAGSTAVEATEY